jgi:hypothetical protein
MEIYGTTTLENKLAIQSAGDITALVRGRRAVVSAQGFEHKMTGRDVRLLAKAIDRTTGEPQHAPPADLATQARIDQVAWPDWPVTVHH